MSGKDARLKAALGQLPAAEPRSDLLPRILRSRATGVRVTLPMGRLVLPWRSLAAAAVVALLIGGSWAVSRSLFELGSSPAVREPLDELLGSTNRPSRRASPWSRRETPLPKYALITSDNLDVTRLHGGIWTYTVATTTDGVLTKQSGEIGLQMVRGEFMGRPAWLFNSGRRLAGRPWDQYADTTYLDPTSLRPLRTVAYRNKGRIAFLQTFSGDSGHEAIDIRGPMERSSRGAISFPFSRQTLFINDWSTTRLAVLLPAFPLTRLWRGTLYQVAWISQSRDRSVTPLDLHVVGTDRVTVPAGTFDCWRMEVETHLWAYERETLWVSRDQRWVIKRQARTTDYVITTVLQSYEPGN